MLGSVVFTAVAVALVPGVPLVPFAPGFPGPPSVPLGAGVGVDVTVAALSGIAQRKAKRIKTSVLGDGEAPTLPSSEKLICFLLNDGRPKGLLPFYKAPPSRSKLYFLYLVGHKHDIRGF